MIVAKNARRRLSHEPAPPAEHSKDKDVCETFVPPGRAPSGTAAYWALCFEVSWHASNTDE